MILLQTAPKVRLLYPLKKQRKKDIKTKAKTKKAKRRAELLNDFCVPVLMR